MTRQLVGAFAKIERAYENIRNLNAEISTFIEAAGYRRIRHHETYGSVDRIEGPVIPDRFKVLIGEIAHHLRSSLDHLVWQLVLHETNHEGTSRAEFPIFNREPVSPKDVARFRRKIEGVRTDAADHIRSLQPYNSPTPDEDALWLIHELDRIDKHRLLIAIAASAHLQGDSRTGHWLSDFARSSGVAPDSEIQVHDHFTIHVVLTDAASRQHESVIPLLSQLTRYTESVLASFDRFADTGHSNRHEQRRFRSDHRPWHLAPHHRRWRHGQARRRDQWRVERPAMESGTASPRRRRTDPPSFGIRVLGVPAE